MLKYVMMMSKTKKTSLAIIILISIGISIPLITWGILTTLEQRPSQIQWSITLFGPTVAQNVSVSYQEIMNQSLFQHFIDVPINYTGCDLKNYIVNCSGITLWDLITYSKVDYGDANAIKFCGSDGCSMLQVNLTTVEQNASKFLIIYALNGVLYGPPPDEGPLKSIVDYTLTAPVVSCPYNTKWLCGIQFITI
jgi:hypothetical protein